MSYKLNQVLKINQDTNELSSNITVTSNDDEVGWKVEVNPPGGIHFPESKESLIQCYIRNDIKNEDKTQIILIPIKISWGGNPHIVKAYLYNTSNYEIEHESDNSVDAIPLD